MPAIRLSVRELVEFLLRTGSIDSRFTGFDRANEGARIHRRLQKAAGEGYAAEVFLTAERTMEGIGFTIEGRADGIFTDEDGTVVIDEIKTTAAPTDAITEDMNPCHWAQGMAYGAICAEQRELETLDVRLTYYQIDTDEIIRYTRHFSAAELDAFLNDLLRQYLPWARRQLDWVEARNRSLGALQFPFPAYRPGQRALAGEVYRACAAGKAEQKGGTRLFCQAPTGIGKTMSALFPALKAMGEGKGEKIFYLTARNTTQAAAEDALARLRAADPALSLRSVTLSAKEKACLCKDAEGRPACLPEACPYANGYYERVKDALAALLDGAPQFDRAALESAARQFTVCPFELGLDLSAWADVVITGEGSIDGQTPYGKVPSGIARLAKSQGKPVIAIGGKVTRDPNVTAALNEAGIVATFGIAPGPAALPELLTGTKRNVEATCAAIASLLSVARECSSRPHQ